MSDPTHYNPLYEPNNPIAPVGSPREKWNRRPQETTPPMDKRRTKEELEREAWLAGKFGDSRENFAKTMATWGAKPEDFQAFYEAGLKTRPEAPASTYAGERTQRPTPQGAATPRAEQPTQPGNYAATPTQETKAWVDPRAPQTQSRGTDPESLRTAALQDAYRQPSQASQASSAPAETYDRATTMTKISQMMEEAKRLETEGPGRDMKKSMEIYREIGNMFNDPKYKASSFSPLKDQASRRADEIDRQFFRVR